ncbi:MAG: hypothetical protein D6703_03550 [Zetaproteobacteria bacterium]|nr:MAG: hypothetical protein D6703_03550 [Zetaproteobacteria bacterium]
MRIFVTMLALLLSAAPAWSNPIAGPSIEERSDVLRTQLKGQSDYHAHLARELATIAEAEKAQHDIRVAKIFMEMAEHEATKSGGEQ